MTVVGNRPEWAYAMVACWRIGAVAQPCTEQLRPADLRARMDRVEPRAVVADARDLDLVAAAGFDGPVLAVPDEALFEAAPAPAAELSAEDPALIVFTSGTAGEPKPVRHGHRYLAGQSVQAEHWYGARPGDLCWCTAASGWSLSARNAFVAAWLRGAAALLHDARFDPDERLELLEREGVNVLCMSPTEYRSIAKRAELRPLPDAAPRLRGRRAAQPGGGEDLGGGRRGRDPRRLRPDRDRPPHRHADRAAGPAGLDGPAAARLPRLDRRRRAGGGPGDACRPSSSTATRERPWRTGDRVREDEDGYLWFEGRTDDVIISAGYRIGPVRGRVGAPLPPRRGRGGGRGGAGRAARPGGPRRGGAARRPRARRGARPRAPGAREVARRRPTSTRASSTSRPSSRRPRAGRSCARSCASRAGRATPGSAAAAGRSPSSGRATRARGCRRRGAA